VKECEKENNDELLSHEFCIGDTKLYHSSIYCDSSCHIDCLL